MQTNPSWKNFDPRVGFAYDPFSDHKTSIRGGFGMFHEVLAAGVWGIALHRCSALDHPYRRPLPAVPTIHPVPKSVHRRRSSPILARWNRSAASS